MTVWLKSRRFGRTVTAAAYPQRPDLSDQASAIPSRANSGLGIVLATDTIWRVLIAPYGLSSPR